MNQDEPIEPNKADVDDKVSSVDTDAPTDSEPVEAVAEETTTPIEAKPTAPQSDGGMKWLVRTHIRTQVLERICF